MMFGGPIPDEITLQEGAEWLTRNSMISDFESENFADDDTDDEEEVIEEDNDDSGGGFDEEIELLKKRFASEHDVKESIEALEEEEEVEETKIVRQKKRKKKKKTARRKEYRVDPSYRKRFFEDSPYYHAYIEKELQSLELFVNAMKDINTRSISFSKTGRLFTTSMRQLSESFKSLNNDDDETASLGDQNKNKDDALDPLLVDQLACFGEILDSIANAQENILDLIENVTDSYLKSFASESKRVHELKYDAENQTKKSEQLFFNYLNGKNAGGNFETAPASSTTPATTATAATNATPPTAAESNIVSSIRSPKFFSSWSRNYSADTIDISNEPSQQQQEQQKPQRRESTNKEVCLRQWKRVLNEICHEETNAELIRFRLCKSIQDIKFQRRYELSNLSDIILLEIKNYFDICSSRLSEIQKSNIHHNNKQKLNESIVEYQKKDRVVWEEREAALAKSLANQERATSLNDDHQILTQESRIEDIENNSKVWELPKKLAQSSKFRRPSPKDVLVEGWLYQQESSTFRMTSWVRRWFIVKHDGIFFLQTSSSKNSATAKVKVCDIVLCTVREVPDKPTARFCFELVISNQKTVTLQARGPKELRMWVDGIRSALEGRLVSGDPNSETLNTGIGQDRRSSEVFSTILTRSSIFRKDIDKQHLTSLDKHEQGISEDSFSRGDDGGDLKSYQSGVLMSGRSGSCFSVLDDDGSDSEDDNRLVNRNPLIKKVLAANKVCADCRARKPDWVSLNLGVLVCLECSGVHRSLGVHVSKVRSLTLDALSETEAAVLFALGNDRANDEIWEKGVDPQKKAEMLDKLTDRASKEEWIKNKYVKKKYLVDYDTNNENNNKETASRDLYKATQKGDIVGMATALAHGADIDWKNPKEGYSSAYEVTLANRVKEFDDDSDDDVAGGKNANNKNNRSKADVCAEFLKQNGAKA